MFAGGKTVPETIFDAYGELSRSNVSSVELSGRYQFQEDAMRRIVLDVIDKLQIAPSNRLLDIGCGPGNLLIPLSFLMQEAVGIDHPEVIARNQARFSAANVRWVQGPFQSGMNLGSFDCILIYSVVQCLPTLDDVKNFLDAAVELLQSGGRCLVGDLPNADKKRRFQSSSAGRAFEREWQKVASASPSEVVQIADAFRGMKAVGKFSDADVVDLTLRYRERGFHAYILPQPPDLPFGRTREDLLIVKP
jgi:2-polyprenyl-3-methyl-5-hydroxy-6-metoxy-1,4-benzoquinol methylase